MNTSAPPYHSYMQACFRQCLQIESGAAMTRRRRLQEDFKTLLVIASSRSCRKRTSKLMRKFSCAWQHWVSYCVIKFIPGRSKTQQEQSCKASPIIRWLPLGGHLAVCLQSHQEVSLHKVGHLNGKGTPTLQRASRLAFRRRCSEVTVFSWTKQGSCEKPSMAH